LVFSESLRYKSFLHSSEFDRPELEDEGVVPAVLFQSLASASALQRMVMLADGLDNFAILEASLNSSASLVHLADGSFGQLIKNTTTFAAVISSGFLQPESLLVSRAFASSKCSIGLQMMLMEKSHLGQLKPLTEACIVTRSAANAAPANEISSASIATFSDSDAMPSYCGASASASGLLAFSTDDKNIFYVGFCLSTGTIPGFVPPCSFF